MDRLINLCVMLKLISSASLEKEFLKKSFFIYYFFLLKLQSLIQLSSQQLLR